MALGNKQDLQVSLNQVESFKPIIMKQYDKNSRTIEIVLKDVNGVYQIPSDVIAKIQATKPDGVPLLEDCDIIDNKITYTASEQFATAVGNVECEIGLYDPDPLGDATKDKLMQSATFIVKVNKSAMNRQAIESSSEFQSLTLLINSAISGESIRNSQEEIRQDFYNAYKVQIPYSLETQFFKENKTTYMGGTYLAKVDNIGTPPTYNADNEYWICIAAKGRDGTSGDMMKEVYDTTDKQTDIYNYADTHDTQDNTTSFIEAEIEDDLVSGETHTTIFGKLLKSIKTFRTKIENLTTNIGLLANLPTTDKTNLVNAIIELNNNKISTNKITQSALTNQTDYIPSSAVTFGLQQSITSNATNITTLNNNLANLNSNLKGIKADAISSVLAGDLLEYYLTLPVGITVFCSGTSQFSNSGVQIQSVFTVYKTTNTYGRIEQRPISSHALWVNGCNNGIWLGWKQAY